jgi:anti-sigma-K factor RskA
MKCAEVLELSGAYALGATTREEGEAVAAHLVGCADCRAEVRALEQVVGLLPDAAPEMVPTAGMRERLMTAVNQTDGRLLRLPARARQAQAGDPGRATAAAPLAMARPRFIPSRYFPAAAAALLAITTMLGAATFSLWQSQPRTYPLRGFGTAAQASGELVYVPAQHTAFVTFSHLNDPGSGRVYELWLIRDGQPVAAGVFRPDGAGHASAAVGRDISGFQVLALTNEPDGGSSQPTGQPLVTQKL